MGMTPQSGPQPNLSYALVTEPYILQSNEIFPLEVAFDCEI